MNPTRLHTNQIETRRTLCALIIDDDPFLRSTLSRQLIDAGMSRTITAGGAAEALEELKSDQTIDLAVCDLMMPKVDGVKFLHTLHELRPSMPVVLISSLDPKVLNLSAEVVRSTGLNVLATLQKPIRHQTLCDIVAQLVENIAAVETTISQPVGAPSTEAAITVAELRSALALGEIGAYVQPQIDARTGRLVSVEALARWVKPDGQIIPPDRFIRLAEENDLIDELSEQVITQALCASARWRELGMDVRVSVNLTADQLQCLNLPDRLRDIADECGVDTQHVVVEVTESGLLENNTAVLEVLARLCILGFELSIDDFGTGYSTLGQLRQAPFSELKVDQTFVIAAMTNKEALLIVESSLSMAHKLKLRTVAEGVESASHADLMTRLRCDLLQGFGIAKPMPLEQLPTWAAGLGHRSRPSPH